MIPGIIANELKDTLLDFLDTTFSFQDKDVAERLQAFLCDPKEGIFKGPYVNMQLPYRRGDMSEAARYLEVHPSFHPYLHQLSAFHRLSSLKGRQPLSTVVTSGTGSGKTECFLYPLLDHCYRMANGAIRQPGVKAVILYPMNALASDQAKRFAEVIWGDKRLQGKVRVGMYVGEREGDVARHTTMGPDHVITDRDTQRNQPPDILLTNYKMLDYLLIRPEDQKIWQYTSGKSLRYLVLDELHSYDGAQGSDVACLIRRLKAKLGIEPGGLCCVGTSATLAGDASQAKGDLVAFAERLFGERFGLAAVISEEREEMSVYLDAPSLDDNKFPEVKSVDELLPGLEESIEDYVSRQCGLWFQDPTLSPLERGRVLSEHSFLRTILTNLENSVTEWGEWRKRIAAWDPVFETFSVEKQNALLQSFLSIINESKKDFDGFVAPFLACQVQLWVREVRRLMRRISPEPAFFWRDEVPLNSEITGLPMVYCRDCGHTGWLTFKRKADSRVSEDPREIYREFFDRGARTCYLFPHEKGDALTGTKDFLCSCCLELSHNPVCQQCGGPGVAVTAHRRMSQGQFPRDMQQCPRCESEHALSVVGSQAASLSSVAVSHLYISPFNRDKKMLAFTDSVQDASHRSGFFAARTFRFNLRTALQTLLEKEESGAMPLKDFGDKLVDYWLIRMDGDWKKLIATFLPPDLAPMPEYTAFITGPDRKPDKKFLKRFMKRLRWEISMEFGLNCRTGRSLEKVGCSTVCLDPALLDEAAEALEEALRIHEANLADISRERLRYFLLGWLTRARQRGAVYDPLLKRYGQNQGNRYFLTKKNEPLMSPFSSESRLPRFLSLGLGETVFDPLLRFGGGSANWHSNWVHRSLQIPDTAGDVNALYRHAVAVLAKVGVLTLIPKTKDEVYAINPDAYLITRHTAFLRGSGMDHALTVAADDLRFWEGMPCLGWLSEDLYQADEEGRDSFYVKFYRRGQVARIFSQEHTSILNRARREKVEDLFKTGKVADAPNLLACTPTLEMGIDVGDLSSVMVCSIPPTATNYLQRIGRGGRKTGNALVLALANMKPHDLFFFEDPFEMIGGSVNPPGCYLDAPEMLKRQFLAFCLDSWAREDRQAVMPAQVGFMLAGWRRGGYPLSFLKYAKEHGLALCDLFLSYFDEVVTEPNRERLRDYAKSELYEQQLISCLEKEEADLKRLQQQMARVLSAIKQVEEDPTSVEDEKKRLRDLKMERSMLYSTMKELREKYPLNLFTDEGLIPNYAFPETGVKLYSEIYGVQGPEGEPEMESHEYIRGAGMAIRELAPFNTFYAEARKVVVDQVATEVGGEYLLKEWRFCDKCHYVETLIEDKGKSMCPKCGSENWSDHGQKHMTLPLRRVSARVPDHRSRSGDEKDEREEEYYTLSDFFDVQEENWDRGYTIRSLPFGFEYLKEVTLREVNFGVSSGRDKMMQVAGSPVSEDGFVLCHYCGVVRKKKNEDPKHRYWCRWEGRKSEDPWVKVYLYRQLESEAIRILLPVSILEAEEKLATFKACLELGLKKKFKGNPLHLLVREQPVPGLGGDGESKHFLVLYDKVPGGTGYLKEFVHKPEGFKSLLVEAWNTLKSCECRQREGAKGCYRCLYAYQGQHSLKNISRELGIEMLEKILEHWDELEEVQTLENIELPDNFVESELEGRFIHILAEHFKEVQYKWTRYLRQGKPCHRVTLGGREWILEPQVSLTDAQGVALSSRPDFVFWPAREEAGLFPVAVFLDGFRYHVMPEEEKARIADDIRKRMSILRSGRFRVWSLCWDDIREFSEQKQKDEAGRPVTFFSNLAVRKNVARKIVEADGIFDGMMVETTGVQLLLEYLMNPDGLHWGRNIAALTLSALTSCRDKQQVEACYEAMLSQRVADWHEADPVKGMLGPLAGLFEMNLLALLVSCDAKAAAVFRWEEIQALLRIEDDRFARQKENYKEIWRCMLGTANLLQFLPGFQWVSRALVEEREIGVVAAPLPDPSLPESGGELSEVWTEALELSDPLVHELLRSCAAAGKAPPEIGFELAGANGRICAEAELAWMDGRVAVLTEDQEEFVEAFEEQEWLVFLVGRSDRTTEILDALS